MGKFKVGDNVITTMPGTIDSVKGDYYVVSMGTGGYLNCNEDELEFDPDLPRFKVGDYALYNSHVGGEEPDYVKIVGVEKADDSKGYLYSITFKPGGVVFKVGGIVLS